MSEKKVLGNRSVIVRVPSPSPAVRTSRTIFHSGPERKISKYLWIDRPSDPAVVFGRSDLVTNTQEVDCTAREAARLKGLMSAPLAQPELQSINSNEDRRVASCEPTPKPKRPYKKRAFSPAVESTPLKDRAILTFREASMLYPASEQALRRLARSAEQYQKYPKAGLRANDFERCLIRHAGSRFVYLNAVELARWWAASTIGSNGR